jgi:anti-sigma factor RsiW
MNTCDRVDSLVSAYLEREASPAEIRFLEDHLTACPRCRDQVRGVRLVLDQLTHLPRVEVKPDFTEQVLARTHGLRPVGIETREPWVFTPPRKLTWAVPLAAAAALALTLVGLQIARQSGGPEVASREPESKLSAPAQVSPSTPAKVQPASPPEVIHYGKGEGESLGMARDGYALGTYELRTPTEGGTPILTPVAVRPNAPVVVTF